MCGNKNKPTYITHRSIQFHWKKLMMRIVEASMRIFAAMPHLWLLPQGFGLHINDLRGNIWTAANGWYRPTWRGWVAPQYGPLDKHQDAWHTSKRRISRDFSWCWRKLILGLCFEAFEPWSAMFFCSQVPSSYPFDLAANFTASTSNIPVRCLERSDFCWSGSFFTCFI